MERQDESKLVPVFEAEDESTAEMIKGLLESEKIPAMVHVHEPMLEGPLSEEPGIWGEILVSEEEADKAREIIEGYQTGTPVESTEPEPSSE